MNEERMRRMKEAGIPMPITQIPLAEGSASAIPITAQNADKHAKLQALRSGAHRAQVQSLVKAQSVQAQGFQGIPEVKQKRRPQGQQQQPVQTVEVESNFGPVAPVSGELAALEAMMGGNNSAPSYNPATSYPMNAPQVQNTQQPELTVNQDGYGPVFDPVGMLAKKRQEAQNNNSYMQYANQNSVEQYQQHMQQQQPQQQMSVQQNFDFQNMQKMMEQIARNTISDVLDSYTERNKEKLTYEHVNVKTTDGTQVIKTADGKYFKLVPVKIKKG